MPATVTVAEICGNFDAYQKAAAQGPVLIGEGGRPQTVLLSYADFVRLAGRDRRVQRTSDLSEEEIRAVEDARMEPGFEYLNSELE